jgi:hypothetical protein
MSRFAAPTARRRPFSWSYSRLKNFETCQRRHEQVDILKAFQEDEGEALVFGNQAHDALARSLKSGEPLPEDFSVYQHWVDRIRPRYDSDRAYAELKLALTKDHGPSEFFGNGAWFRGVVDYIKMRDTPAGTVGLLIDWKTGKVVEDSVQLALFAALAFAHYPLLVKVRTEFVWLKDDVSTREDFTRADMGDLWASLAPRIQALEHAHNTGTYLPVKGRLCRLYCPVTSCEFHGS